MHESYLWICGSGRPAEQRRNIWVGKCFRKSKKTLNGSGTRPGKEPTFRGMKTILENGARPVAALGRLSAKRAARSVDWARSFFSLTIRKSHNGLRQRALTRIAGCARSYELLRTRGWKNVDPKKQNKRLCEEVPSATHPLDPGEQNPTGSPEFVAVSPQYASQQKEKMSL